MTPDAVEVPASFATATAAREGAAGRAWLAEVPRLVRKALGRWGLTLEGRPWHGVVALVLPVRRSDGTPAALKVSWLDAESRHEPVALRVWAGRGAVRILAEDRDEGLLLLERLDGDRSLEDLADHETATRALADVLVGLSGVPVPDALPHDFPTVATTTLRWARRLQEHESLLTALVGRDAVEAALRTCHDLAGGAPARWQLLHGDLHYANVLPGRRDGEPAWLAIDPKPLLGPPEWESVGPLWNRWDDLAAGGDPAAAVRRRLTLLCECAGLDLEPARRAAQLRALDEVASRVQLGLPIATDHPASVLARVLAR